LRFTCVVDNVFGAIAQPVILRPLIRAIHTRRSQKGKGFVHCGQDKSSLFQPDVVGFVSVIPLPQKLFCLHVFRQAGPPQRVDCLAPRWETALCVFPTQRRATASGVEPKFRNLSITSPELYQLLSHAAIQGEMGSIFGNSGQTSFTDNP